jgi:hypothetical protein
MADLFDEEALQKYFKRLNVDQLNQQAVQESQGMANPAPNPYSGGEQKKGGFLGAVGKIAAPVMKLGGMVLSAAGMPYVGIPLSVAGGAVGGASDGGGISGALKGGIKSGIAEGASLGIGSGLSALGGMGSAGPEAIMTGSKLSAPLDAAIKSPEMMSNLGGNLAVSDPLRKLTMPYAGASGMDIMRAGNGGS